MREAKEKRAAESKKQREQENAELRKDMQSGDHASASERVRSVEDRKGAKAQIAARENAITGQKKKAKRKTQGIGKNFFIAVFCVLVLAVIVHTALIVVRRDQINRSESNVTTAAPSAQEGVTWEYDEATQTITFSGTGEITYDQSWRDSEYYDSIAHVQINPGITVIDDWAFNRCNSLTEITLPDSVKVIGTEAFSNCESLTDVYYSGTEEQWQQIFIRGKNEDLLNATIHYGE